MSTPLPTATVPLPAPLTTRTPSDRQAALARCTLLRPPIEDGVPLARVAVQCGRELRTLQRWLQAYRRPGLAGVARAPRRDRGTRTLPTALVQLIDGLALRSPRPTAAAVHRQGVALAPTQGWPVPSSSTVYAIIRGLDPALTTLAHAGATAYATAVDLIYRRTAARPNDRWQADHTPARPVGA